MIKYRKQNALEPEKDTEISLNLIPVLLFMMGFLVLKTLIRNINQESNAVN